MGSTRGRPPTTSWSLTRARPSRMPGPSSTSSGAVFLDRDAAVAGIRAAAQRMLARRPDVREAWLFGSLARGDATPRSDADLLFVVDEDSRRPVDRVPDFLAVLTGIGRPLDVLVFTAAEWEARRGSRFHHEVTTRGLRLDRDGRGWPP
ncbi:MAG: nucleotidyltransferase domain-containing protein [Candidatus Rokuibacteriota bacterium]